MDHFTSRAHHSVFLFVAEEREDDGDASGAWCVRAFRLTHALKLQEEPDVALVSVGAVRRSSMPSMLTFLLWICRRLYLLLA